MFMKGPAVSPGGLTFGYDLWPVNKVLSTVREAPGEPILSSFLQQEQLGVGVVHLVRSEARGFFFPQLSVPLNGFLRRLPEATTSPETQRITGL